MKSAGQSEIEKRERRCSDCLLGPANTLSAASFTHLLQSAKALQRNDHLVGFHSITRPPRRKAQEVARPAGLGRLFFGSLAPVRVRSLHFSKDYAHPGRVSRPVS